MPRGLNAAPLEVMALPFDVLGTTDRFLESSLLVARALNWSVYDALPPTNRMSEAPQAGETCARRTGVSRW